MAMTIFFVLNGVGVVFLLYVLANFWREGHPPKKDAREYATEFWLRERGEEIVMTHPISQTDKGVLTVIPFQSRRQELRDKPSCEAIPRGTLEVPVRRISTR